MLNIDSLAENEGWGWPIQAKKAHYFVDGRSLCGNWMYTGRRLGGPHAKSSPDDCKACTRELAKAKG